MRFTFFKMYRLLIPILILLVLFTGCAEMLGAEKLGERIFHDGGIIVLTQKENYDGVGIRMVPPKIEWVEKDNRHVVVRTLDKRSAAKYWLIDKTAPSGRLNYVKEDSLTQGYYQFSNVFGPLDSTVFSRLCVEKRVTIKWNKHD